jgi:DNA-binding HxlR family transcriptional regulator
MAAGVVAGVMAGVAAIVAAGVVMFIPLSVLFLYQIADSVKSKIKKGNMELFKPKLEPLIALCHRRWSIPILAELHRDNGAKFVTLVQRLQISRDALSRTLEALMQLGLVKRNTGYGHPLRPEYILTPTGKQIGQNALELLNQIQQLEISSKASLNIALKKWTLPILHAIHHGINRFSSLRETLPNISPRALTLTLQDLEQLAWLIRSEGGYELSANGKKLAETLEPLAQKLDAATDVPASKPSSTLSA